MTELEALTGLNLLEGIGTVRLKALLQRFESPAAIFRASLKQLMQASCISEETARNISCFEESRIEKEFVTAKRRGLKIISWSDPRYPASLKQIYDPPYLLYVKGELKEEDILGFAVVGSRMASFYGLSNAERFSAELSRRGFTIISGMARGIDTYAHKGALKAAGRTIAVMGSGFGNIYPAENGPLAERIAAQGAVISEFPIETQPLRQNFPRRNRIISGLSLGVLVVEAAQNSGALITADFALEQGREVFALPGRIESDCSRGANNLIKEGAKLVSCPEDILSEFNILPAARDALPAPYSYLSEKESLLYSLMSAQPVFMDELLDKTDLDISAVFDILLKLQMKKLIRELPGKQFMRN